VPNKDIVVLLLHLQLKLQLENPKPLPTVTLELEILVDDPLPPAIVADKMLNNFVQTLHH